MQGRVTGMCSCPLFRVGSNPTNKVGGWNCGGYAAICDCVAAVGGVEATSAVAALLVSWVSDGLLARLLRDPSASAGG